MPCLHHGHSGTVVTCPSSAEYPREEGVDGEKEKMELLQKQCYRKRDS